MRSEFIARNVTTKEPTIMLRGVKEKIEYHPDHNNMAKLLPCSIFNSEYQSFFFIVSKFGFKRRYNNQQQLRPWYHDYLAGHVSHRLHHVRCALQLSEHALVCLREEVMVRSFGRRTSALVYRNSPFPIPHQYVLFSVWSSINQSLLSSQNERDKSTFLCFSHKFERKLSLKWPEICVTFM